MGWDSGAIEFSTGGTPQPPDPQPPSTKFKINDRVSVTNGPANVRQTPGGALMGQQPNDIQGVIVAGPTAAAIVGSADPSIFNWWNVNFDSGVDGWMGEGTLMLVASTPVPTPIPPSPLAQVDVHTKLPVVIHRRLKPTGKIDLTADKGVTVSVKVD